MKSRKKSAQKALQLAFLSHKGSAEFTAKSNFCINQLL
jgi:hypothetical protein